MKILAIRIRNLASLEGTTDIDFTKEPLCSAGIFAITGPTGAGKSTILDALCLALYAKTPRYVQAREIGIEIADVQGSTINQSDVRAILRDGTAEGYAEVDFVAIDGQHYRATWGVRRARNKAGGSLQQASIALKNLSAGSDIGGKKTELLPEIARLVGLNYEQFIRSVLLAQGDFTAFLKADKDQKASLLEKLTGTHIYSELSRKVFERCREEEQQLKLLQKQQEGITILTTEELADLDVRQATLAMALEQLQVQIDATTGEIKWHEDLSALQAQVHEARQALQVRLAEKAQSADRELYLKQVEQVQPIRASVDLLHEASERLAQRKETHEANQGEQQLLALRTKEADATVAAATRHLEVETTAQEAAMPLLDEAKRLDVQLLAKEAEVTSAQQQLNVRRERWASCTQRLATAQQKAGFLEEEVQNHLRWQDKNSSRRPVAENRTLIVTRLGDACKQLEAIGKASEIAARLDIEIKTESTGQERLTLRSQDLVHQVEEAQVKLAAVQNELSGISSGLLGEESHALTMALDESLTALAQWVVVRQLQLECETLLGNRDAAQLELGEKEAQLSATETTFQAANERRKASAALLEKATIAASENVEALRTELVDGQPCPVCGSEAHPYAYDNPQLNHVLDELRKSHEALEEAYDKQLAGHSRLTQTIPLLKQTVERVAGDLHAKQKQLALHIDTWKRNPISEVCVHIAPKEKERWLHDRAQSIRAKQQAVSEQLHLYEQRHSDAAVVRQALEHLRIAHTDTANAVKDLKRSIEALRDRLAHAQSEQSAANASLNDTLATLQPYFPDHLWIANWKNQPDQFLKTVNDFADQWEKTAAALERDRNELNVSRATVAGIQKEERDLAADIDQWEGDLTGKQADYQALVESRRSLFHGEAAARVEARLKRQITEAGERLTLAKQSQAYLQQEKSQLDAAVKEGQREISKLEKRIAELTDNVDQWLADYNARQQRVLEWTTLHNLLAHPVAWIAEEREVLATIERAVTQATSVLDERSRQLGRHEQQRLADESLDYLREQLAQQRHVRSESQRDHNEIDFRLKQDERHKQHLGDLLATIRAKQTVVEHWSRLNEIIGSADGKKFRQVAQEYTLDVLLSYANVHLQVLSKRYHLQRTPHTLGLQVLDQDMGDEVRTVYSLSGGESFLVSLALALGLASLSANRMNVESLFIDEGFGSLDPNTLNIAMDALERLHNQGRKVGVISHVQEMTERIPVQIKVSKQGGGKALITIDH